MSIWVPWRKVRTVLVWSGLTVATLAVLATIIYVVFFPLSDVIARHDVGSITGPHRASALQAARDAARGRLIALGAGLFAAGALVYTARNFSLARQGQVTDRYTKAIEQLDPSKSLDLRVGAIYALERIARDSPKDHPTIMEVLAAFIREHSGEQWPQAEPGAKQQEHYTRPDVQAAVTVIGRRTVRYDRQKINLTCAILVGADLTAAHFTDANLRSADLRFATLAGATLVGADLSHADLTKATLESTVDVRHSRRGKMRRIDLSRHVNLTRAYLHETIFEGAKLSSVNFNEARLERANFKDAHLIGATFIKAQLTGADFTSAWLALADFRSADFANEDLKMIAVPSPSLTSADFADANLTDAHWPQDAAPPADWQRDPSSGRLKHTGIGSSDAGGN